MLGVGVAESVPVTLMVFDPFTLYVVLKLAPVPEAGMPPVAVQENVTVPVPPVEVAVHVTAVPTVPVVGQLIVTVNDTPVTVSVKAAVLMRPPVAVPTIVNG